MTQPLWKNKALGVGLAGAGSLVVLVVMLVLHAWPLWTGRAVYLKVEPVDPRDLFRGDYVILGYPCSQLRLVPEENKNSWQRGMYVQPLGEKLRNRARDIERGAVLYVQLKEEPSTRPGVPKEAIPVSVSDKPVAGAINLAGRNNYSSWGGDYFWVQYGIEAFFVQQNTGHDLEAAIRNKKDVYAEVMVTERGKARVRALIVDGKRVGE